MYRKVIYVLSRKYKDTPNFRGENNDFLYLCSLLHLSDGIKKSVQPNAHNNDLKLNVVF